MFCWAPACSLGCRAAWNALESGLCGKGRRWGLHPAGCRGARAPVPPLCFIPLLVFVCISPLERAVTVLCSERALHPDNPGRPTCRDGVSSRLIRWGSPAAGVIHSRVGKRSKAAFPRKKHATRTLVEVFSFVFEVYFYHLKIGRSTERGRENLVPAGSLHSRPGRAMLKLAGASRPRSPT